MIRFRSFLFQVFHSIPGIDMRMATFAFSFFVSTLCSLRMSCTLKFMYGFFLKISFFWLSDVFFFVCLFAFSYVQRSIHTCSSSRKSPKTMPSEKLTNLSRHMKEFFCSFHSQRYSLWTFRLLNWLKMNFRLWNLVLSFPLKQKSCFHKI